MKSSGDPLESSPSQVAFRVRGSQESSEWIEPPTEEDEEEKLRKELVNAQKKLKKQQQLQEWMKIKEEKAAAAQKAEEEERSAMQQAEAEKEKKRLARVKKIKRKINGYHEQIKTEAEKIQELMEMGIDPNSLF